MKKKNGFTLVELIAAITILGVLLLIGSQVVIDTMNKNKAHAVYTSMDNVSKQARLIFLEDPEEWEVDGELAIKNSINYNEKDMVIGRDNAKWQKEHDPDEYFGGSRVVCIGINGTESKFKNLKFDYFVGEKDLYCSYDVNRDVVYHFRPMNSMAKEHNGRIFKTQLYEKDDYFFYLENSWQGECFSEVAKNTNVSDVDAEDVANYTKYEGNNSPGNIKLTEDEKKDISKVKVAGICKVFISEQEFNKYRVK